MMLFVARSAHGSERLWPSHSRSLHPAGSQAALGQPYRHASTENNCFASSSKAHTQGTWSASANVAHPPADGGRKLV